VHFSLLSTHEKRVLLCHLMEPTLSVFFVGDGSASFALRLVCVDFVVSAGIEMYGNYTSITELIASSCTNWSNKECLMPNS